MTLLTTLNLNLVDPGCPMSVARLDEALGGIFGDGVRLVMVKDVLIPPQLNLTIASQETDPDIEQVYFLLRRACDVFDRSIIEGIIDPIRVKVAQTQDLSLLTDDERVQVHTLNALYNSDIDGFTFVRTTFPESGLIT